MRPLWEAYDEAVESFLIDGEKGLITLDVTQPTLKQTDLNVSKAFDVPLAE